MDSSPKTATQETSPETTTAAAAAATTTIIAANDNNTSSGGREDVDSTATPAGNNNKNNNTTMILSAKKASSSLGNGKTTITRTEDDGNVGVGVETTTTTTTRPPSFSLPHDDEEQILSVVCGATHFRWALHQGRKERYNPRLFWRTTAIVDRINNNNSAGGAGTDHANSQDGDASSSSGGGGDHRRDHGMSATATGEDENIMTTTSLQLYLPSAAKDLIYGPAPLKPAVVNPGNGNNNNSVTLKESIARVLNNNDNNNEQGGNGGNDRDNLTSERALKWSCTRRIPAISLFIVNATPNQLDGLRMLFAGIPCVFRPLTANDFVESMMTTSMTTTTTTKAAKASESGCGAASACRDLGHVTAERLSSMKAASIIFNHPEYNSNSSSSNNTPATPTTTASTNAETSTALATTSEDKSKQQQQQPKLRPCIVFEDGNEVTMTYTALDGHGHIMGGGISMGMSCLMRTFYDSIIFARQQKEEQQQQQQEQSHAAVALEFTSRFVPSMSDRDIREELVKFLKQAAETAKASSNNGDASGSSTQATDLPLDWLDTGSEEPTFLWSVLRQMGWSVCEVVHKWYQQVRQQQDETEGDTLPSGDSMADDRSKPVVCVTGSNCDLLEALLLQIPWSQSKTGHNGNAELPLSHWESLPFDQLDVQKVRHLANRGVDVLLWEKRQQLERFLMHKHNVSSSVELEMASGNLDKLRQRIIGQRVAHMVQEGFYRRGSVVGLKPFVDNDGDENTEQDVFIVMLDPEADDTKGGKKSTKTTRRGRSKGDKNTKQNQVSITIEEVEWSFQQVYDGLRRYHLLGEAFSADAAAAAIDTWVAPLMRKKSEANVIAEAMKPYVKEKDSVAMTEVAGDMMDVEGQQADCAAGTSLDTGNKKRGRPPKNTNEGGPQEKKAKPSSGDGGGEVAAGSSTATAAAAATDSGGGNVEASSSATRRKNSSSAGGSKTPSTKSASFEESDFRNNPAGLVGKRVAKYFDKDLYYGEVVEYNSESDNEGGEALWSIRYEDDDTEDMNEEELKIQLKLFDKKERQKQQKQGKLSSSSKKRK